MDQSSAFWGARYFDQAFQRAEWQAHPYALERLARILGGRMRDQWFAETYMGSKPAKRAIGIGVGRAETEIGLLVKGHVEHYDLYDISPVGLDYAKNVAERNGVGDRVTCHCADITKVDLPRDTYDLATFVASLHHMADLEATLWAVNGALRSEGLLFAASEYVGPDRFAYPEEHVRIARAFHRSLPDHLRKHRHPELLLPTAADVEAADPSEAPCSSQIMTTMARLFPRSEVTPLYGSLAFILIWGLDQDALYDTPDGRELMRFVLGMDQALVEAGVLPTYFAHIVARKTPPIQERAIRLGIHPNGRLYQCLKALGAGRIAAAFQSASKEPLSS